MSIKEANIKSLKRSLRHVCLLLFFQAIPFSLEAQHVALRTNLVYDSALMPSLGIDVRLDSTLTLGISSTYCPISYSDNRKWKNWSVQPEIRHWFRKAMSGSYIGLCTVHGGFNFGRIPLFGLDSHRVQGNFNGVGVSFGRHRVLSPHWGIESSVSLGYVHLRYRRYREGPFGYMEYSRGRDYIGPISVSVSLVYVIK